MRHTDCRATFLSQIFVKSSERREQFWREVRKMHSALQSHSTCSHSLQTLFRRPRSLCVNLPIRQDHQTTSSQDSSEVIEKSGMSNCILVSTRHLLHKFSRFLFHPRPHVISWLEWRFLHVHPDEKTSQRI